MPDRTDIIIMRRASLLLLPGILLGSLAPASAAVTYVRGRAQYDYGLQRAGKPAAASSGGKESKGRAGTGSGSAVKSGSGTQHGTVGNGGSSGSSGGLVIESGGGQTFPGTGGGIIVVGGGTTVVGGETVTYPYTGGLTLAWPGHDPEAAMSWANNLPDREDREAALVARTIVRQDSSNALLWTQWLTDQEAVSLLSRETLRGGLGERERLEGGRPERETETMTGDLSGGAVPEPGAGLLLGGSLMAGGLLRHRRK